MKSKDKPDKIKSATKDIQDNKCPEKEGDNCLVPGVYNDSDPIGGGG